nr:MAG TPA: hypothetical protein [Caudoviricetes sp.]
MNTASYFFKVTPPGVFMLFNGSFFPYHLFPLKNPADCIRS